MRPSGRPDAPVQNIAGQPESPLLRFLKRLSSVFFRFGRPTGLTRDRTYKTRVAHSLLVFAGN